VTTSGPHQDLSAGVGERQRVVIVLASSALHDARAHRIAVTLAARGHLVTMIGRIEAGLSDREVRPDGVVVLRVPVSAADGLPLPRIVRDPLARRWAVRARRRGTRGEPTRGAADSGAAGPRSVPSTAGSRRLAARLRRGVDGAVRIVAVILTVRSQARAARSVAPDADVVVGMGFLGLPVALGLARRGSAPVVYEAGDVYVEAGNIARLPGPIRRTFAWLEGRWARRAALVTTANEGYAAEIARRYRVATPLVLLNCPPLPVHDPNRETSPLRAAAGLPGGRRIVLYHGGFSPGRGIEQLVSAIPDVSNATLVLLGYGSLEPVGRAAAARDPEHVVALGAVGQAELLGWIAGADLAAMPIQPTTLNHRLTVPNKLFEAMAAGVPVLASDLPGMAPIVRATGCGILVDPTDRDALVAGIRRVLDAPDEERAAWSEAGRRAVRERYSWERESPRLLDALEALTGKPW
jgi:glycosyltransferase involved in cell wall biosynthesis